MLEIKEIKNYNEWDNFVLSQLDTLFVQSSNYGRFYQTIGEEFWIIGIYENGLLIGGSLVVSTHAKRGNFLYLPYGPIMDFNNDILLAEFSKFLTNFGKQNKYDFIRVSPFIELTNKLSLKFKKAGFRLSPMHVLAETTCLLDITPSEDELLAKMEKGHRYLIKRCQKEGVKITITTDNSCLQSFNDLHDKTAERHKFHRFSPDYINNEFAIFSASNQAVMLNAYLPDGRLDASSIILLFGKMAAYRHSASLNLNHKLSTSYLIQWEAIKDAKRKGLKCYNFWGIAPENAKKDHPFFGLSHFKKGFGGKTINLLPAHDLPLSKLYWLNWLIEKTRHYIRKF